MTKQKTIRVMIEMPTRWWSDDSPTGLISWRVQESFNKLLNKKIDEEIIPKLELPKIEITAAEVKDRMLQILAEKALEDKNGNT